MNYAPAVIQTLPFMGFEDGIDYQLSWTPDSLIRIEWFIDPHPTDEEVEAARLPALRAAVVKKIKADCERRQFVVPLPYVVSGTTYFWQMDRDSRGRYAFLLGFVPLMMGQGMTVASPLVDPVTGQPTTWWTKNPTSGGPNIPVGLTIGQFIGMVQAGAAREGACDAAYRAHLAAVSVSSDPENYDFSTGWPA